MQGWSVERSVGPAGAFHARDLDGVDGPTVWIHRVEQPALVLGSSQRDQIVDHETAGSAGVEVCRRRSGGGLVLVEPDSGCWIDVLITPDDPRWSDDVNRAFHWVGEVWRSALASLGVDRLGVHRGPIERPELGRFLCFGGLGPGEVVQRPADGAAGGSKGVSKVVGLSQRRQRRVARFQGLLVEHTDVGLTRRLVRPEAWPPDLDVDDLRIGLDQPIDLSAVPDAVLTSLPAGR